MSRIMMAKPLCNKIDQKVAQPRLEGPGPTPRQHQHETKQKDGRKEVPIVPEKGERVWGAGSSTGWWKCGRVNDGISDIFPFKSGSTQMSII
jgi:hypothetical protein